MHHDLSGSKRQGVLPRALFKLRYFAIPRSPLRVLMWRLLGMRIGPRTNVSTMYVTWPHQVSIGKNCRLEHNVYFHYDGMYAPGPSIRIGDDCFIGNGCEFNVTKAVRIGDGCLIAAGTRFVDHDHGMADDGGYCHDPSVEQPITVENKVWIGANAVILKGVKIGESAVVAAGAVVNRNVPPHTIVGGVPARQIGTRRSADACAESTDRGRPDRGLAAEPVPTTPLC